MSLPGDTRKSGSHWHRSVIGYRSETTPLQAAHISDLQIPIAGPSRPILRSPTRGATVSRPTTLNSSTAGVSNTEPPRLQIVQRPTRATRSSCAAPPIPPPTAPPTRPVVADTLPVYQAPSVPSGDGPLTHRDLGIPSPSTRMFAVERDVVLRSPPPPSSFKPAQLDPDVSLGFGSRTVIHQASDYSLVLDRTMAGGHVQRARER